MNISNIFVVATSLVALANANPTYWTGDFGTSSAGGATMYLTDLTDGNTGRATLDVTLTSKTSWNASTSAVAAFVVCFD